MFISVCVKRHMCSWGAWVCAQRARAWTGAREPARGTLAGVGRGSGWHQQVLIPVVTVTGENSECDNVTARHKLRNPLGFLQGRKYGLKLPGLWRPRRAQNISQWIQLSNLTSTQSNEIGVHHLFKNTSAVSLVLWLLDSDPNSNNLPLRQCLICRQLRYIPQPSHTLEFIMESKKFLSQLTAKTVKLPFVKIYPNCNILSQETVFLHFVYVCVYIYKNGKNATICQAYSVKNKNNASYPAPHKNLRLIHNTVTR